MAAYCRVTGCKWITPELNKEIAGCLATWHVYENHKDVWFNLFGERPPLDPDPRIPGVRKLIELGAI